MLSNKIKITFILAIIFSVSVVSITQAAPPLQGRSGTSQGHALDLDAEGNNLGTVMNDSKAEDGSSDNDAQNRIAAALANYFDEASYEDIMALHESGVGFGNIARALFFTAKFDLGIGVADLALEAGQSGWGKTLRDNGIHPGSLGKGRGNQPEHADANANNGQGNGNGKGNNNAAPGSDDNDDAVDSDDDDNGNGNGRGNGKSKGNNGQGYGRGKNNTTNLDDDDAADSDDDVDNGNGNGRGNGKRKGNNGKGNGQGNGNGNNGQGNGNNGNNGQYGSDGN